jgi:site-specific DNA recombinase
LVTRARCGCAYVGETKKGTYTYYHCTGNRGPCGNTYVREEDLSRLFGETVKRVRIPAELANAVAQAPRESLADKATAVRTSTMRLQQQQLLVQS